MSAVYFDYNATTPVHGDILPKISEFTKEFGNPSSLHHYGRASQNILETARMEILDDFKGYKLVFTSSGIDTSMTELAKIILPSDIDYNIIKIARNSWHVTFLYYPTFMEIAHPSLYHSMKVLLHKNQLGYREYKNSENPPILHRKETFLHSYHPRYEEFSALTSAEEEAGLLSRRDIGFKKKWEDLLLMEGYEITGHTLRKI